MESAPLLEPHPKAYPKPSMEVTVRPKAKPVISGGNDGSDGPESTVKIGSMFSFSKGDPKLERLKDAYEKSSKKWFRYVPMMCAGVGRDGVSDRAGVERTRPLEHDLQFRGLRACVCGELY